MSISNRLLTAIAVASFALAPVAGAHDLTECELACDESENACFETCDAATDEDEPACFDACEADSGSCLEVCQQSE